MDRIPGAAILTAHVWPAARVLAGGILMLALIEQPVWAQSAPPGSTINGTVPTSEGNVWNGFDHQPTPAEAGPDGSAKHQARINHKLGTLNQQLLNDPLPKIPAGAPPVEGN